MPNLEEFKALEIFANGTSKHSLTINGFRVNFLYAKDNAEAKKIIKENHEIAVVILNIKNDDLDDRLKIISFIKKQPHTKYIRIILKSNDSNFALKEEITHNYEIDGYFSKISSFDSEVAVAIMASIRAYKQLVNTNKLLKSLAGSIAHEVRNPLNAIALTSSQIKQSINHLSEKSSVSKELEELSSMLSTSVNRANQIVNITLKSLREEKPDERNFTKVGVSSAIKKALSEYSYRDNDEKSRTIFNKSEIDDFDFRGDETLFIYVIFNIVKNALHYFKQYPNSKVEISLKKSGKNSKYNQIIIKDSGPGIAKDKLDKIFNSFTSSGKKEGTGLGLAFCMRTMEFFKGKIKCESKLGKYTKFILSFPVNDDDLKFKNEVPKNKILIVDDQKINLKIAKDVIEERIENIRCLTAMNGKEAVEVFKAEKPSFILMDIQMPVMDGYRATEEIRKLDKEIPIIAYTSLESTQAKKRAVEVGIDHYITKPISHNILIRTIDKWLINRQNFEFATTDINQILQGKRVILADDQKINNILLERMLINKFNMKVDSVENGEDLVKYFKQQVKLKKPYDIILTDIHMEPGMSGHEAATQIRNYEAKHKLHYKTPIIAITGDDEKHLVHKLFRSGIDDYKKKDGLAHQLLENIMAFWVNERSQKKIQNDLLTTKIAHNPKVKKPVECEYYDNDYDKVNLVNKRIAKDQLIEVTDLFIDSCKELIEKIRICFKTDDIKQFRIHAHSLKGISGNMGMERLYRFSHNLHEASKEIDVITNECMTKLDKVFLDTKNALMDLRKG